MFEDEIRPTWNKIAEEILHNPQHKNLIKYISQSPKRILQKKGKNEDEKQILNSLNKILGKKMTMKTGILSEKEQ
jgi:hypothetical protein